MLNIDGLYVHRFDEDEDTYYIEVKEHPPRGITLIPVCPGCLTELINYGKRTRQFQDLPMHGKKVQIIYRLQRYRCPDCGKTSTESVVPEMDESRAITKRFIEYVVKHSANRHFTSLADELGVHEKSIRNIVKHFHENHSEFMVGDAPRVLGIDEVHLVRSMRCVIVNIETAQFYDILETRSSRMVTNFLMKMPNRNNVEVVCMDMYRPYLMAARHALKDAVPVIDKFHVLRYATIAMDTVRKHTRKLPKDMRKSLKRERFVLIKRPHKLNPFQLMNVQNWSITFPELGQAYRAKESFFDIYNAADRYEAESRYVEWLATLPPNLESAFLPLTTAVGNWHKEIFNYFDHRYTNATTEALNGIIKHTNRTGRGYTFDTLRKKILARDYPSLTTFKEDLEQGYFLD